MRYELQTVVQLKLKIASITIFQGLSKYALDEDFEIDKNTKLFVEVQGESLFTISLIKNGWDENKTNCLQRKYWLIHLLFGLNDIKDRTACNDPITDANALSSYCRFLSRCLSPTCFKQISLRHFIHKGKEFQQIWRCQSQNSIFFVTD